MADKNEGGPAFPHIAADGHRDYRGGMSLRDYFAARVIGVAYERVPDIRDHDLNAMFGNTKAAGIRREEVAAAVAYRIADAMIARRDSVL